ncbi:E3 ubiquitin-protein ligase rbbp6 [Quaeritorhiza haematococci]|nr:E3 ubiquitin-protein ligase rbbp6 [Quaeritorhiza haematococci]
MSVVYYKFKSAKDYDTATFDGLGISVFDLKREIMTAKKLGKGTDFDLVVANAQTNEAYNDDMYVIPRNTQILVSRTPPAGKHGTAQRYVNSAMPSQAMLTRGHVQPAPQPTSRPKATSLNNTAQPRPSAPMSTISTKDLENMTEEERIQAMFKQTEEHWASQEKMLASLSTGPFTELVGSEAGSEAAFMVEADIKVVVVMEAGRMTEAISNSDSKDPQDHPHLDIYATVAVKKYDGPRLKRTTGIPKIFLKVVDDKSNAGGNVMVTQNGELVVARPNDQAWAQVTKGAKYSMGFGSLVDQIPVPEDLKCGICQRLCQDADQVPCCKAIFCDTCIRQSLTEPDEPAMRFRCPNCKKDCFPDDLVPAYEVRTEVERHLRDIASKQQQQQNQTGSPAGAAASTSSASSSPAGQSKGGPASANGSPATAPSAKASNTSHANGQSASSSATTSSTTAPSTSSSASAKPHGKSRPYTIVETPVTKSDPPTTSPKLSTSVTATAQTSGEGSSVGGTAATATGSKQMVGRPIRTVLDNRQDDTERFGHRGGRNDMKSRMGGEPGFFEGPPMQGPFVRGGPFQNGPGFPNDMGWDGPMGPGGPPMGMDMPFMGPGPQGGPGFMPPFGAGGPPPDFDPRWGGPGGPMPGMGPMGPMGGGPQRPPFWDGPPPHRRRGGPPMGMMGGPGGPFMDDMMGGGPPHGFMGEGPGMFPMGGGGPGGFRPDMMGDMGMMGPNAGNTMMRRKRQREQMDVIDPMKHARTS